MPQPQPAAGQVWCAAVARRGSRRTGPPARHRRAGPMSATSYTGRPIGLVESPLVDRESAPRQGDEGAPDAWIAVDHEFREAMRDLTAGADVIVLTWLDRADRGVLSVHPRS